MTDYAAHRSALRSSFGISFTEMAKHGSGPEVGPPANAAQEDFPPGRFDPLFKHAKTAAVVQETSFLASVMRGLRSLCSTRSAQSRVLPTRRHKDCKSCRNCKTQILMSDCCLSVVECDLSQLRSEASAGRDGFLGHCGG